MPSSSSSSPNQQQHQQQTQSSPGQKKSIPPHLQKEYEKQKAAFMKKKQEFLMKQSEAAAKQQKEKPTEILPQPMRGMQMKSIETSMDFLVRLSDVNNSAHAVQQQQEKINQSASAAKNPAAKRKLLSQLPDLTRLLLEVDMRFDRAWGIPNTFRGYVFIAQVFFILCFTLIVPWSIVNARNSEVSLWAKQAAASWTRSWLTDSISSSSDEVFAKDSSSGSNVMSPVPSATFVVSGNDGVANVFKRLFDESNALPSSWIPVGSLVFSVAMGDAGATLCPSSIAPVPVATTSSSTARKVTCMPFGLSLSNGLQTSTNFRLQGIQRGVGTSSSSSSTSAPRPRINIDPAGVAFIGEESDMLCLGAVCAPQSFRQVGWSFPSVNDYPHNAANFLKWRVAAPMNSTSWRSQQRFGNDLQQPSSNSGERVIYYSSTEQNGAPVRVSTTIESYDAISNLVEVPGSYLALALAEFTVFDTSSDSLIFFSLGFETQGGAGGFTGKLHISSFSFGDDGRNVALRSFGIIFSVSLLAFTILLPFAKVFIARDIANCSGCHFDETMKRRPFKTVTWAKCVSCKQPVLVKGAHAFRCDSCSAVQPAAEHHRCWRGCVQEPGWILNLVCSLLGLLWGGADGVTLGHVADFLSLMQSQVTQYGVSFLTFRNLATLMNLHQRGLGALVLLFAAINAQRVFWHIFGGPIALAWLQVWRRATGIFAMLFVFIGFIAVISSWSIGLPAYRNGATQGSTTESFDPPGIVFTWAQAVIWWLGRFFMLAIIALGLSIVIAGGSASSRVDAAAQLLYDPDWKSVVLCWMLFKEYLKNGGSDKKSKDGESSLPKEAREAAMRARSRSQILQQQQQQAKEKELEKLKQQQQKQKQEEVEQAEKKSSSDNVEDEEMKEQPQPVVESDDPSNSNNNNNNVLPKHPVDPVLDEMDKEDEYSADPLTYSIDKLERCVSKLMLQLPPILEDAVDERLHFSLMEQSRKAVAEEGDIERSRQFQGAMQHVEGMRQAEWERQAKVLEELDEFYEGGNYSDDEDEEEEEHQLYQEMSAVQSRPRVLGSSAPNFGEMDDDEEQYDEVQEQGIALLSSDSISASPNKKSSKKKGVTLRPQSSIKFDSPDTSLMKTSATNAAGDHSPKYGRGVTKMNVDDLMALSSSPTTSGKKFGGKKNSKKNALIAAQKLPKANLANLQPNPQPSFTEFTDLHEAAQIALRNEIAGTMARQQNVNGQMEYLSPSSSSHQNYNNNNFTNNDDYYYNNNTANQQQQQQQRPTTLSSNLPLSYGRSSGSPSSSSSPNVVPHKYRSQDPSDYVVQHLLDEDEIEDVLQRENSPMAQARFNDDPRNLSSSQQRTPPQRREQSPTVNWNNYNNNNNSNQQQPAQQQQYGRYSGLPPSQVLQPREPIGRPFGGAPSRLDLPQPPLTQTGMKPRHY